MLNSDYLPGFIMQHLYDGLGTMNVSEFPACIRALLEVHRAQCQRRAEGWSKRRVVLALPPCPSFEKYTRRIEIQDVDVHFDHVIYFDQTAVKDLLRKRANEPLEREVYDSKDKPGIRIAAPKGQFVQVPESCQALAMQSISLWFAAHEVYWLSQADQQLVE